MNVPSRIAAVERVSGSRRPAYDRYEPRPLRV